jgi:hypothetical protein
MYGEMIDWPKASKPHLENARRRTAAERQDVGDAVLFALLERRRDGLGRHVGARQVHVGQQPEAPPRLDRQLQGQVGRGAAGAPGEVHEERVCVRFRID